MRGPAGIETRRLPVDFGQDVADQRHLGQVAELEQFRAKPVIDVMGVIRNIVRKRGDLRLRAREAPQVEINRLLTAANRIGHAALAIATDRIAAAVGQRTVVFGQPFQRFPGKVEPIEHRVAPFERRDDPQRLCIVIEAATRAQAAIERPLTGMPEWRVAKIVGERKRFGQVLVETERARQRARNLGDFQSVGQPRSKVIALMEDEDLRLVRQAAEGARMNDAVAITAEDASRRARGLGVDPAAAPPRVRRVGRPWDRRLDRHARFTRLLVEWI